MASCRLLAVDFEVFGRVQGVFFRKYTMLKGRELELRGWVKNTVSGSVVGQLEGTEQAVTNMKDWLQRIGSPHSCIERCSFTNERVIENYTHNEFHVRH